MFGGLIESLSWGSAPSSCRNSKTARNDSDQLGLDPVVIHVSQPLLESLSMVQTVGGGVLVSPSLAQPRDCTLRCGLLVSQLEDGPQLVQS